MNHVKLCLIGLFMVLTHQSYAQNYGFPFRSISPAELEMKIYPLDTTAGAVVLNEFGEAYFLSGGDFNLMVEYHIKIKILKKSGYEHANFRIRLDKGKVRKVKIHGIEGSTFNMNNGVISEHKLESSLIYREEFYSYDLVKFALPAVREGSVIDVVYSIETPFIFNFWPWQFQSDIPKVYSEFWAKIPGNYVYNMSLRGTLKLTKNESTILKNCFTPHERSADCAYYQLAMKDIPAFIDEPYMTARINFLAMLNFELSDVKYFNGLENHYTRNWNDVSAELLKDDDFGVQIRKARNIFEETAKTIAPGRDSLTRAKAIFRWIAGYYQWNERLGRYAENGVGKAFDTRIGNGADINFSLLGALQVAGFQANPVILSTRANGIPVQVHPVITDYNHVVVALSLNNETYLLDASESTHAFGLLPERCLNGKGRIIDNKEGSFIELKCRDKRRKVFTMDLVLSPMGTFAGTLTIVSFGYEAADLRKKIPSRAALEAHKEELRSQWHVSIDSYVVENSENIDESVTEKMKLTFPGFDNMNATHLYLNPFFADNLGKNPFQSPTRNYPVDFGAPWESTYMVKIEYPESLVVEEVPSNMALSLPEAGGKFLFSVSQGENRLNLTSRLQLNKTVYFPHEYASLRELYSRILQLQQSLIVIKKK